MKKVFIPIFILLISLPAWAIDYGTVTFKDATYNTRTNTLDVAYDLTASRANYFNYAIELYYSLDEGQTFVGPARLVRGDAGANIAAGANKTIQWDFSIEAPNFDGASIMFSIKAKARMRPEFYSQFGGPLNAAWSALLPGLGDTKVRTGSPYKYYGITAAALGSLGAGVYFHLQASDSYKKYQVAETTASADDLFAQAQKQSKMEKIFFGSALAIWLADITLVAIKGSQNKKLIRQTFPKSATPQLSVAFNHTTPGLGLRFTF